MGATTHSKLDRAVVARYYAFLIISQLIIFTLIGVLFISAKQVATQIGKASLKQIIENLRTLPATVNSTYINQSSYWLTFFPLRGFLAIFDLAQIINLVWISFRTQYAFIYKSMHSPSLHPSQCLWTNPSRHSRMDATPGLPIFRVLVREYYLIPSFLS